MNESLTCKYCGKECKSKMSKVKHEYFCHDNPDYDDHLHIFRETTVRASKSDVAKEKRNATRWKNIQEDENERYMDYTFTCEECGNPFVRTMKIRNYNRGYRIPRFCSHACANSKHVCSDETKEKIRNSLLNKPPVEQVCPKCGKTFSTKSYFGNAFCPECAGPKRCKVDRTEYHEDHCIHCGRPILINTIESISCPNCAVQYGEHVFRVRDPITGKMLISDRRRSHLSDAVQRRIKDGKHTGWTSRKIISYPEKFWQRVLDNNNIQYNFNHPVKKSSLGVINDATCYFLDFCIDGVIDLEIDGKQHQYEDRHKSDVIRDERLMANGYFVYRISWNDISTKQGSDLMRDKIDSFLKWLKEFRLNHNFGGLVRLERASSECTSSV